MVTATNRGKRDLDIVRWHRRGDPIASITARVGISHTVMYRTLRRYDDLIPRTPRITPWTAEEDALIAQDTTHTARELGLMLGRSKDAVTWRRAVLRRRAAE